MARQDWQVVEYPEARRERRWQGDHDSERIGGRGLQLSAAYLQRVGQRAAFFVIDRVERKQHIVRREWVPVRKGDVRPEFQRVGQTIFGPGPAFSKPRFDVLRDVVDANELGLREVGHRVGTRIACRVPVEGAGLGSNRDDQSTATRHGGSA